MSSSASRANRDDERRPTSAAGPRLIANAARPEDVPAIGGITVLVVDLEPGVDLLHKPFNPEQLVARASAVVRAHRQRFATT